ncbi:MAG: hypothetical protein Q4B43_08205 [Bacteroidota bacterium]|nr:hypothetical protein [Bacteroidota bacterium]
MKKLVFFLFILLGLSCDDGDMEVTTFNFTSHTLKKCDNQSFVYNANAQEILLLDIPLENFANHITYDANGNIASKTYTLTAADKLLYRLYSEDISNNVFCSEVPFSYPQVQEEWVAKAGGKIVITTYANEDITNGGILQISNYTHHIVLKDVIFEKGEQQMVLQEYVFGNYNTPNLVRFDFQSNIQKCESKNLFFNLNQNEALVMELNDSNLFVNQETNGTPRVAYVDSEQNNIIYKVFDGSITSAYFCSTIPNNQPLVVEEWYVENTVNNQTGIIEVQTEKVFDEVSGTHIGYKHILKLKVVNFYNSQSSFYLEEYLVGNYFTAI